MATTAIDRSKVCNENVPEDCFAVYVAHKGGLYACIYPVEMFRENPSRIINGIARGIANAIAENK